ncbi:DUF6879 family protein [Nocardia vinacea]|uniref:DUF6879 family protein n=1 Tax=Nocardia vinacea TaxID=96468 RepID=UPI0033F1E93F
MELRPTNAWSDAFQECRHSAFHMEVRDTYAVPAESEPLRRFLNGETPLIEPDDPWEALIREITARGVFVSRVRAVSLPLSDYQRWLLSVTAENIEAGEDIRYLPRHRAEELPSDDWWLFDNERVAFNLIAGDSRPAGTALTVDPNIAQYCRSTKERLWKLATPYAEFVSVVNARQ